MFGAMTKLVGSVADVATRPLRDTAEVVDGLARGKVKTAPAARLAGASLIDDTLGLALDVLDVASDMASDD